MMWSITESFIFYINYILIKYWVLALSCFHLFPAISKTLLWLFEFHYASYYTVSIIHNFFQLTTLKIIDLAVYVWYVCVCACVRAFILFHLLVSSGCTTSVTYVRSSHQRSFVVNIIRGFCQVPSSLFSSR